MKLMEMKEVKIIKITNVQIQSDILSTLESIIYSWKKTKGVITHVILYINKLKQRQCSKVQEVRLKENHLHVEKIHNAKKINVKLVQEDAFGPDIKSIKKSCWNENNLQHTSLQNKTLEELKPFAYKNGNVRVGKRHQNSSLDLEMIHPIIFPKTGLPEIINTDFKRLS